MDKNYQDKTESKRTTTEDKLWLPPLSPQDQKKLTRLQKNRKNPVRAIIKWTGFSDKALWDWLQLLGVLAIPLILGIATLLFGIQQAHLADLQHQSDQQRALDQQQATILQTYIDNIQDLLLNHNLLGSKPDEDVATLARARTLTGLQGLDPERKGLLVKFIYEARLIGFVDSTGKLHRQVINLNDSDLSHANLSNAILTGANLAGANLSGATIIHTDLSYADLLYTNLAGANLNYAYLSHAYLSHTYLSHANLSNAILTGSNLAGANLSGADLSDDDLSRTNLQGASYNTKKIQAIDIQGNSLTFEPTHWPQGFVPTGAGTICVDC